MATPHRSAALPLLLAAAACGRAEDEGGIRSIAEEDVRGIARVTLGEAFAGRWTLTTTVSRTSCDDIDTGGALPLPTRGQVDRERLVVTPEGELTRDAPGASSAYVFHSRLDGTGTFAYGFYDDVLTGLRRIQIVTGVLTSDGGVDGAEGLRRDLSSLVDCASELRVTGRREGD